MAGIEGIRAMTAHDLADALVGRREGREWRCRCPLHGGRSLFIREQEGRILFVCRAGCSQDEVIKALRELGLWGSSEDHTRGIQKAVIPEDSGKKEERADALWNQSHYIEQGDPVHTYLKNRGIVLPEYPADLRCHAALSYWEQDNQGKPVMTGVFPAMLAVVRNATGRPVALHRTYLTTDGQKAPVSSPKKIIKVHDLTGAAVRLFAPKDGFIAVSEGIEDAISAWLLWGIPCWACLGTSGLRSFVPPGGNHEILILADSDDPGKKAAFELSDRLEEKKMAVRIWGPRGLKDLNEVLRERNTK